MYDCEAYSELDIQAPVSSSPKGLAAPPTNPSMSTWWDRIAIAFIAFLFLLALLVFIFVVMFLVEYPEAVHWHMSNTRFRLIHI